MAELLGSVRSVSIRLNPSINSMYWSPYFHEWGRQTERLGRLHEWPQQEWVLHNSCCNGHKGTYFLALTEVRRASWCYLEDLTSHLSNHFVLPDNVFRCLIYPMQSPARSCWLGEPYYITFFFLKVRITALSRRKKKKKQKGKQCLYLWH